MRLVFITGILFAGFPLLIAMEAFMAAHVERLPEPQVPEGRVRTGTASHPFSLLVLGDSTAAGEGAPYDDGIVTRTVACLAQLHTVTTLNLAVSGATAADVRKSQLPRVEAFQPDAVLLAVGANDVTHLRSTRAVREDLTAIVEALWKLRPDTRIVLTGSPDLGSAPLFAQPLRAIAGARTRVMNRAIYDLAEERSLIFAPIADDTGPLFRADRTLFASDGFHPNARGYATWLPTLARALGCE